MNDHVLALYLHEEYSNAYVSPESRETEGRGIHFSTAMTSIVGALVGVIGFVALFA